MIATVLAATLALTPQMIAAPEVAKFPGPSFNGKPRESLQRRAVVAWPGPSGLAQLWESGGLPEAGQVAVLLGGAAFHDVDLLPIYMEAIRSPSERVRQAAAVGYRDLIGDRLPNVARGVSEAQAEALRSEMAAVARTTRTQPLISIWLHSALATEDRALPGYSGVVIKRGSGDCLRSVDALLQSHDLNLVILAFGESQELSVRLGLLKLVEGLTMQRFLVLPEGRRAGWTMNDYTTALSAADTWISKWREAHCSFDFQEVLAAAFAKMGLPGVDAMSSNAFVPWQQVLLKGDSKWWQQASRRLYAFNGPGSSLSTVLADSEANKQERDRLLSWYGLR